MVVGDRVTYTGPSAEAKGRECIVTSVRPDIRYGMYVNTDLAVPLETRHGTTLTGISAPINRFELFVPTIGIKPTWEV